MPVEIDCYDRHRVESVVREPLSSQSLAEWPPPSLYRTLKVAAEFGIAVVLLALTSPLVLLAALLVKLTSRGPVFYSQVRLGRFGRPYPIFKIRTMVHNCEKVTGAKWSMPRDPRVTPVGRFLRRTHLDELPQLWNVMRGDMSLIGPRPERPEFISVLEQAIPHYAERLLVRPGVTGLAQVQLPGDTDLESVRRKLAYDLYYIRQPSFWLDLRILLCTAFHMLGVPYRVLRGLCRMPTNYEVERVYRALSAGAEVAAQIQPA
jgi:lipopolysaccharide/colanic/teichoic acid biosynthesis glycosyltransferase